MKVFGVTVHFVDDGVDTGPIVLQTRVELPEARPTPARSSSALRPLEHALLPRAVRWSRPAACGAIRRTRAGS